MNFPNVSLLLLVSNKILCIIRDMRHRTIKSVMPKLGLNVGAPVRQILPTSKPLGQFRDIDGVRGAPESRLGVAPVTDVTVCDGNDAL